jgi:hypothetical protein
MASSSCLRPGQMIPHFPASQAASSAFTGVDPLPAEALLYADWNFTGFCARRACSFSCWRGRSAREVTMGRGALMIKSTGKCPFQIEPTQTAFPARHLGFRASQNKKVAPTNPNQNASKSLFCFLLFCALRVSAVRLPRNKKVNSKPSFSPPLRPRVSLRACVPSCLTNHLRSSA